MPSGTYIWSQTAGSNGSSDSAINMSEGMAPSAVNDGIRSMMAVLKKHDDDISGAIVTGGTSTSYTVATYTVFDSLAHMGNQLVAFTPHAPNGATVVLNVDGLGAKPLRSAPSTELLAGTLIQGTPYTAIYNSSDAVFYLHGFYGNPYNIPLAGGMDFWGTTVPNSSFAFPVGQAISRTTYSALFAIMSTTYGVGDGSTTFNLPDKTGRVSAMKEASATRLTVAGSGINGATMGAANGLTETHVLTAAQLAQHTHAGTTNGMNANASHSHSSNATTASGLASDVTPGSVGGTGGGATINATNIDHGHTFSTDTGTGVSNAAHNNVQPTIVCNYIIRVL